MRIGVNTLFLIPGQVGGSETYLRETLKAMVKVQPDLELVLFTNLENDSLLREDLKGSKTEFHQLKFRASNRYARIIREQVELPFKVKTAQIDVLWSPGYTAPFLCSVPQVVSILDMQYKHHPEDFSKPYLLATHALVSMSAKRASRIIAISEFSKSEIINYTGQPADKIDVTLLAGDESYALPVPDQRKREVLSKYGIGGVPYILCVANTYPHKQVHVLVEAYSKVMSEIPHRLVILGRARLGEGAYQDAISKVSDRARVTRIDYIAREDLPAIYQSASLFVFPSVYEGFGLPVLEAMMAGVPVLTTRKGSIPEVGASDVEYFKAGKADALAEKLRSILGRAELDRIDRSAWIEKFSWEKTAEATLRSLQSAISS